MSDLDPVEFKFHYKLDMDEWTATHPDKPNRVWLIPNGFLEHSEETFSQFLTIIAECRARSAAGVLDNEPLPEFADPDLLFNYRQRQNEPPEQGT